MTESKGPTSKNLISHLRTLGLVSAFGFGLLPVTAVAAPDVVVSIKPVHSLVAGVMAGVGTPMLLVKGSGSPHVYSLRPSEARAISQADLVFWIGEDMESFLVKPLQALGGDARVVELSKSKRIELIAAREGGTWDSHAEHEGHDHDEHAEHGEHDHEEHAEHSEHDHEEHAEHSEHDHEEHAEHSEHDHDEHAKHGEHAHGEFDLHIWLDPHNAEAIITAAAESLQEMDPKNAAAYMENAGAMLQKLGAMEARIAERLTPVKDAPYVVFHDAYHYFETHFGTNAVGSVTVNPDRKPGAKRLSEIREKLSSLGAVCLFSEPQFEPTIVDTLVAGTSAGTGVLDPLGADLEAGEQAYFELMEGLADSLYNCLSANS